MILSYLCHGRPAGTSYVSAAPWPHGPRQHAQLQPQSELGQKQRLPQALVTSAMLTQAAPGVGIEHYYTSALPCMLEPMTTKAPISMLLGTPGQLHEVFV
jgi:hypothetical protein